MRMRKALAVALPIALAGTANGFAADGTTYTLTVDGLACPFCAYGVEKQLGTIQGVVAVETDIKSGTVTVTMKAGAALDKAAAKEAVKEAGFTFENLRKHAPDSGG